MMRYRIECKRHELLIVGATQALRKTVEEMHDCPSLKINEEVKQ